jgi:hypothetical protein
VGAGCYYTHKETKTKAFWVELDFAEEEEDTFFLWDWYMEEIGSCLELTGYSKRSTYNYFNGLFEVCLESTYEGDGLVVRLEPCEEYYNLAMANHDRSYDKIKNVILSQGFELRIATSGYTSTKIVA